MQGAEVKGFPLYVGIAEVAVVAINPTNEELVKLGRNIKDDADEESYTDEKEVKTMQGDEEITSQARRIRFDFHLQPVGKNDPKTTVKKSFWLLDTPAYSEKKKKYQYVNQVGESAWVEDESQLNESFTKFRKKIKDTNNYKVLGDKKWRLALKGEADILAQVRMWLSGFDYYHPSTNIFFDTETVLNGDVSDFKEQVGGKYAKSFGEMFIVRVSDKDGKEYQGTWKTSIPGKLVKTIPGYDFSEANIQKWITEKKTEANPGGRYLTDIEKLAIEMTTGEYKCKDFYHLGTIKPYNADDYLVNSEEVVGDTSDLDNEDPDY